MRRHTGQRGAGLIMLIGITAALAILAASLVMLLTNQQGATARERSSKTSLYYAEAALNSAIAAVKLDDTWLTTPYSDAAAMTAMATNFNTLPAPLPTVTYRVYDDEATIDASTPAWDHNTNTKVWVQVTTTYHGRTTRLRQMVASKTDSVISRLPKAAAFAGGAGASNDITMTGLGDVYVASYTTWPATNINGTSYSGGAPFPTSIMAKGDITSPGDLAPGTGHVKPQSVGVMVGSGRSVSITGVANPPGVNYNRGNVPDLTSYLSLSDQVALEKEARSVLDVGPQASLNSAKVDARPLNARPADQRPAAVATTGGWTEPNLRVTGAGNLFGTYVAPTFTANKTLVYTGNLTLLAGYTYKFTSLTVNGNLIVNGNMSTTAGLRVTGTLSIASTTGTNDLGPVYAVGNATITGAATNNFDAFWTDGSLSLNGTGATKATTLHAGASGLSINSTSPTNANDLGTAYVIGDVVTTATSTSKTTFGALWTDGNMTLNGRGVTTTGTLHVGKALTTNSTVGANTFASTYVIGAFSTSAASTSSNRFGPLWVDGNVTLNGSGATTTNGLHLAEPNPNVFDSLHVGGAFSINSPAITNVFGPTYVIGAFGTTVTSTSTNHFGALWVDGNVTLNGPLNGLTTTNTTALHVGGDFTIDGPASTNTFGPIYVIGDVNWHKAATVKTTDYTDAAEKPGPMWVGGVFTRDGGPFNDEYGDTFVVFRVNFTPNVGHSTVLCPLFATTEMITTSGDIDFGTMVVYPTDPDPTHTKARPMTLYLVCDNDGLYTQTAQWNSTGQFTGLMILFEAGITLQNGNATKPAVVGSVLTIGGDNGLKINNNAQIAYSQDVIDWVFFPTVSTSTVTQTVPGTWQELSPSGP